MVHQAIIEAGAPAAGRIARALDAAEEPLALSVSHFELGNGQFEISALYGYPPARNALATLIDVAAEGEPVTLRIEEVSDQDWVTVSQGKRGPVRAGRFFVHGSHDRARAPRHRFVIEIDAGQAFGTAHHASTRGCLLAIDDELKRRRPRTIVDIGTGTGVLAIAAANALKRSVLASDNDPIAVAVAADNAGKNCARPTVRVIEAPGFAHPRLRRATADLILANLVERPLRALAPEFARHMTPGGVAILSGLTASQAGGVAACYCTHGFAMKTRIILDGWATLVLTRRSARALCD
ncbi:MAG: 50S ribosomal protein L11 methyltransferase [Methyloceanibacter sp.]|uniref:50S ribosomal protein L11 methyltransferase n=1 Tax=Methyloceanibacter sp. TaxID=1965321 RepID=UPI003D6D77DC